MNARRMIADAGYQPEAVAALTQAFEDAWSTIASRHATDHERRASSSLAW